jgi:transketolase C-terminal domain/subunit
VTHRLSVGGTTLEVVNLTQVKPVPDEVIERVRKARRWYVIEDHVRLGGVGDLLVGKSGRPPDGWFGWPADWPGGSGGSLQLRIACGLDTDTLARAIKECSGHG